MASSQPFTIRIKGDFIDKEAPTKSSGSVISPGYLVSRASDGTVIPHGVSGGAAEPLYAQENFLMGHDINTAYSSPDTCLLLAGKSGCEVQARVPASAAAIVIGDDLMSNGDGTLVKKTSTNVVVARALQAVNNSGGSSQAFIIVEIA